MEIRPTTIYINRTLLDNYIWNVKLYMMKHYGCDIANCEIDPLAWYINTGRASIEFLHRLVSKKPYMIGRLLHKGGSYDETVERIREYIYR